MSGDMNEQMNAALALWPVLVQVTLTLSVFIVMGARKGKAVKAGLVDRKKAALDNSAWPDEVLKVSNNIQNQFQTPILFYVLVFAFVATQTVSMTVLVLAWVYVISRLIHAYIHTGSNYVPARFRVFIVGVVTLIIMSGVLASSLISISL